uniref:(California timema) hypothetical protein n=1 Tax=Timema californicum TaxID=61474 RepID=A0A7R9P3F6_TIMCA|nr:unnamed protein product [Timema californicum]
MLGDMKTEWMEEKKPSLMMKQTKSPVLMTRLHFLYVHSVIINSTPSVYSSPMASLVLTDGFEKLPDKIMYPYAEPNELKKHHHVLLPVRVISVPGPGIEPRPPAQKSDTLPLDRQCRDVFVELSGVERGRDEVNWGRSEEKVTIKEKKNFSTYVQDLNLDLSITSNPVQHESDTLDHLAMLVVFVALVEYSQLTDAVPLYSDNDPPSPQRRGNILAEGFRNSHAQALAIWN